MAVSDSMSAFGQACIGGDRTDRRRAAAAAAAAAAAEAAAERAPRPRLASSRGRRAERPIDSDTPPTRPRGGGGEKKLSRSASRGRFPAPPKRAGGR